MSGASPLTIEAVTNDFEPGDGFRQDFPIPLSDWKLGNGTVLTTGTTPRLAAFLTNVNVINWAFGSAATDVIQYAFTVPRQWAVDKNDLVLRVWARKKDAASDENADLKIQCQMYWHSLQQTSGGTATAAALSSLTTPVSATLAASSTGADASSFALYELDLGAQLTAESKALSVGSNVRLVFGPNETVGTTDMALELIAAQLRTRVHPTYLDRSLRSLS